MELLKECFRLGNDRFTGLSISQHWGVDKEAFEITKSAPQKYEACLK